MKISATGLVVIKAFEGCHQAVPGRPGYFRAYADPVGVLTIGYGHTNHHDPKFAANTVWSRDECDRVLALDMGSFERHVELLADVPLEQHEFDALVSWSYNTGGPPTATLWRKLNAGDKKAVPAELAKWDKAKGKVLAGLTRRRACEGFLFAGKIDEALRVAGAKRPPTKPTPIPPPPDIEPVEPQKRSWVADLFAALVAAFKRK